MSIHPGKAPGLDGFSAGFFQANWDTVGEQITAEIQSFFISGNVPNNINATHVRLIPKILNPQKVADYRPIALCSVYYKIIAKLLTKRLQPILGSLLADQSAFVPNRAISDNVLITHEVLHYPQCLLARTFIGKYCRSEPFLTCSPPNNSSHGWRSICIGRDLLKSNLGKCIGNGQETSLWYDDWLSLSEQRRPIGPPTENSQHLLVSDLINHETGEWNISLIRELLPLYEKDITALKPSKLGAADKLIWLPSISGDYTSKSGGSFIMPFQ